MKTLAFLFSSLFVLALFNGCSGGSGTSGSNGGGGNGGGSSGPASLADVQAIFDAHCIGCHDAQLPQGIPYDPSLSLVASDTYAALVNTPATAACGGTRVVPGAPDQSFLMKKLEPGAPCSGSHMPRPFEVGPELNLSAKELETVRSWIAAGAPQ